MKSLKESLNINPGKGEELVGFLDQNHGGKITNQREEEIFVSQGEHATDRQSVLTKQLAEIVLAVSELKLDPKKNIDQQEDDYLKTDPLKRIAYPHWVKAVYCPEDDAVSLLLRTDGNERTGWKSLLYHVTVSRSYVNHLIGPMLETVDHRRKK